MEESRTDYSFQEGRYKNDTGFLMAVEHNIATVPKTRHSKQLVKKLISDMMRLLHGRWKCSLETGLRETALEKVLLFENERYAGRKRIKEE